MAARMRAMRRASQCRSISLRPLGSAEPALDQRLRPPRGGTAGPRRGRRGGRPGCGSCASTRAARRRAAARTCRRATGRRTAARRSKCRNSRSSCAAGRVCRRYQPISGTAFGCTTPPIAAASSWRAEADAEHRPLAGHRLADDLHFGSAGAAAGRPGRRSSDRRARPARRSGACPAAACGSRPKFT